MLVAFATHAPATNAASPLNAALNEQVLRLRLHGSAYELETTLFKPPGAGPFPLLVINHGKQEDNVAIALERGRARFPWIAHEFVKRGFLVAVPMRRGFAGSDGVLPRPSCDLAAYARHDADDVRGAVEALARRSDVDPARIVVAGNSAGGMASVAYAESPHRGVKAIVTFAGGLRLGGEAGRACWPAVLVEAHAAFGSRSRVPQLWVYAENDAVFPPAVVADAMAAFRVAGGQAELLMLRPVGATGHDVMTHPAAIARWLPEVLSFLATAGLTVDAFPGSGYATAGDLAAFPGPSPCREQYGRYLGDVAPKAYALSPAGRACSWAARDEHASARALAECRKQAPDCQLYAYDDIVVWKP